MVEYYQDEDGVLDYTACSDYRIGQLLGIQQEKVRALKLKKQARYPIEFDWRKSLVRIQGSIRYDNKAGKVIIPIRDSNLYNDIRNFIEDRGGYIEAKRGYNCIQMRPEFFFLLIYEATETDEDKAEIRKRLGKKLKEQNEKYDIDSVKTQKEVIDAVFSLGVDVLEIFNGIPVIGQILGVGKVVYNAWNKLA